MTLVDRLIEDGMARANAGREDFGPDLEASFLEEVSRVRRHQARYAEAFELAQRVSELREKHWGEHHPLTSRAKKRLADVYYKRRDFRSAETIGLGVLYELLSYVGPHHPDVAGAATRFLEYFCRRRVATKPPTNDSRSRSASGRSCSVPTIRGRFAPSRRARRCTTRLGLCDRLVRARTPHDAAARSERRIG